MLRNFWLNLIRINFSLLILFSCSRNLTAEYEAYSTNNFLTQGDFEFEDLKDWAFLAEERRRDIAHELGFYYVGRWEPKCELFIAKDRKLFFKKSNAPRWARGWSQTKVELDKKGVPIVQQRRVWVYPSKAKDRESVLSHEIAHLLFREFLDYDSNIPLWLDEGVAIWAEQSTRTVYKSITYKAVKKDNTFPFNDFFQMKRYPSDKRLFYSQSSSIIRFLISEYGTAEFQRFSRLIRDGERFEEAMARIYGARHSNLREFEQAWKNWVLEERES